MLKTDQILFLILIENNFKTFSLAKIMQNLGLGFTEKQPNSEAVYGIVVKYTDKVSFKLEFPYLLNDHKQVP